jgi:hypothetical protein
MCYSKNKCVQLKSCVKSNNRLESNLNGITLDASVNASCFKEMPGIFLFSVWYEFFLCVLIRDFNLVLYSFL